jgi:hypothetical protein
VQLNSVDSNALLAATTTGGKVVFNFTLTVNSVIPKNSVIACEAHIDINGKRLTNTPVRMAGSVLKCPDDRKNRVVSAQATYPCGSSAVGGRVCEQRYAAERVLPESRFELQHTGSPSKETALEEKAYANFFGWWLGAGGVGDQEIADAAGTELWAGRGPAGRPRRLATSARSARVSATPSLSPISL